MNEMVNQQTWLFFVAIEIGVVLAMCYDLIRIFRRMFKQPNWMIQIEDTIYWILAILISFAMLYQHNFAEIRLFVFLGIIMGAILYLCTLSIVFMKIATYIITLCKAILIYTYNQLLIPLRWLLKVVSIPCRAIGRKVHRANAYKRRKVRQSKRRIYYMKSDFKSGIKVKLNKNIYNSPKND